MAQVLEFKLPDLGEGLTEAEIVRWLVAVGDVVAIDQPVVEVETAKAMVEVPCPYGGVVTARFGEEGTELPVGAPLLTVAVGAADLSGVGGNGSSGSSRTAEAAGSAGAAEESSGNVLVGYGTGAPAARRRRIRPAGPSRPCRRRPLPQRPLPRPLRLLPLLRRPSVGRTVRWRSMRPCRAGLCPSSRRSSAVLPVSTTSICAH